MVNQVIIVPPPKECVVADGKRYCREEDMSNQDVGLLILSLVALVVWSVLSMWVADRTDSGITGLAVGLLPFVALGTWLVCA